MEMHRPHILICGRKRAGKTTLIDRIIRETSLPVYGYKTQMVRDAGHEYGHVYMVPAGRVHINGRTRENEVGIAGGRVNRVNPEVFNSIGCKLVRSAGKNGDGMIVMDEIGYMEDGAEEFCRAVREAFDGNIPVLASIKRTEHASRHIDTILHHPKANVFMLTESNREEVYAKVSEIVKEWERDCDRNLDRNCDRDHDWNSDRNRDRNRDRTCGRNRARKGGACEI